ncbi:AsmA family protein [Parvicella tangerina]|uniref:AsmA-like C-terminal domain-containing protein n=1 Tax=Parvicella tangerina TaxID=2829795 RepID=A0A916NS72_9FLAO|nr:AsmA-like C-terminal region-containing protein [Parvicella tangerina]CAG5083198.1 hypothetical protein CRYO30217_02119 [Parvicella tangerina]
MKLAFLKRRKFWIRFFITLILVPVVLFMALVAILYWKQDEVVEELVSTMNEDFEGHFEISGSHISPFENFPYISIDLEGVKLYENESKDGKPIVDIKDVYVGFNLWDVVSGSMEIKSILLEDGNLNLVQHIDGSFNLLNALASKEEIEDPNEEFHLDLKSIELENIDINKLNEANGMYFDVFVNDATSNFKTSNDRLQMFLDSKFIVTYIDNGDTTFIHDKHFDVHTEIDYLSDEEILEIVPSEIALEGALFKMEGIIDFANEMYLDLKFHGEKPNFDLLMAFAPDELTPTLKKYDNQGQVYFKGLVKGKSINGHSPFIDAEFGCSEAFFANTINKKKLDDLQFKGHFTNGEKRDLTTIEFSLQDFSAKPEAGVFSGDLLVKNFAEPEIDLKLISDFQLDFLANFFNLEDLKDLSGGIELTMNFHDIIDLQHPEKSIEKLNESYYTELKVTDLSFSLPDYHLPLKDLDLYAVMDGHEAHIDHFDILIGNSDLHIEGTLDDLPAILHHTEKDVLTHLEISSKVLDILELTQPQNDTTKGFDEVITDLSLGLSFKSSARDFTESPNLPIGEFFIDDFHAQLKHYPHEFHDFHADLIIEEQDMKLVDFTGMIDKSDFHFSGGLSHYDLWFAEHPLGDTKVEFNLTSAMLQLEDIFSYGGENYVPEDYRHEEFDDLIIHGVTDLHFNEGLQSTDVMIDKFESKMKVHHLRFEDFGGRVHLEDEHLTIEDFRGTLGKSKFLLNTTYYYGADTLLKKKDNYINLKASRLDFDELFAYEQPAEEYASSPEEHEAGFNIYQVPFPNLTVDLDIDYLNYHLYKIKDFSGAIRIQPNHYIYIDTLAMTLAGGDIHLSGYFNGSDPSHIYFKPKMRLDHVDLDKMMVKFENFGQDHLVSENLHGKLSGDIWGKIHMHADMVPIIDDSEIHMDFSVLSGKLENYGPMEYLSEYFADKNVAKIIFDTLQNHIDMQGGVLSIPNMTINTSLGFVELSGKQNLDYSYEYYLRVPWKMVTKAGASKLFGKKKGEDVDPEQEDEIIYAEEGKKVRYVNIQIIGDLEDYSIKLKKEKKDK